LGGVSDGFALEGFTVLGIDIEDMPAKGYKHAFIRADIRDLKGEDFRGYDVIWGSPPCRDFSQLGVLYGKRWKNPPSAKSGLGLIECFNKFVKNAQPTIWIMENVALLKKYYAEKPRIDAYITRGKRHVFYGNFPLFLLTRDMRIKVRRVNKNGRDEPNFNRRTATWEASKIPLVCSRAFARACKEKLEEGGK
jgi:site-specific DNA-cytosine methylase